jgi:dGTPase
LAEHNPQSAQEIRELDRPVVAFSEEFREKEKPMRKFLFDNMYRHYKVNRMMGQAGRVVSELFELFINDPDILPTQIRAQCNGPHTFETARIVCDYIAAMTDSFALSEHRKLFTAAGYLSTY